MRIPTEHFSHVPVVALSPTMLSPTEQEYSITSSILSRVTGLESDRGSVGSAPSSPKLSRMSSPLPASKLSASFQDKSILSQPHSLLPTSPARSSSDKRCSTVFNFYANLVRFIYLFLN